MKQKGLQTQTIFFLMFFVFLFISVVLFRYSFEIAKSSNNDRCPAGKVCMSETEYNKMLIPPQQLPPPQQTNYTKERDLRVLRDPLYPALNRGEKSSFENVVRETLHRNINIPTQNFSDSYRLVGYLTTEGEDDEIGKWKLMARQKDRNRGDFYMIPVNNNFDMKVQITDDMTVGEKLRDIDTVPNEVTFKSALLSKSPYKFSELPKTDFTDEYF